MDSVDPTTPIAISTSPTSRPPIYTKRSTFSNWTSTVWSNAVGQLSLPSKDKPKETASLQNEVFTAACILRAFTLDAGEPWREPSEGGEGGTSEEDGDLLRVNSFRIPIETVAHCHGLAIFSITQSGGFVLAGSEGSGVVVARLQDGTWSDPCSILLQTTSFGFAAGHATFDVVLVLRTSQAVQSFKSSRIPLGGEITIHPGPVGDEEYPVEIGADAAPIWVYVKSKSDQSSLKLEGNVLLERADENERAYGRPIQSNEILEGQGKGSLSWTSPLVQTILAAEGKENDSALIPKGLPPSSLLVAPRSRSSSSVPLRSPPPPVQSPKSPQPRRLPPEDLDEDDLAARREMEEVLRQFGIVDPNINVVSRMDDPLLVQGSDLAIISTPPLSGASSRTSGSSVVYPLSLEEDPESPNLALKVPLKPEPIFDIEAASIEGVAELTHSSLTISDDVEEPPSRTSEDVARTSSETTRRLSLDKPPVPPRRSPKIVQEATMKREEETETPAVEEVAEEESGISTEEDVIIEDYEEEVPLEADPTGEVGAGESESTVLATEGEEDVEEPTTPVPQTPKMDSRNTGPPLTPTDSERSEAESFQEAESGVENDEVEKKDT